MKYVGVVLKADGKTAADVSTRAGKARTGFNKLQQFWKHSNIGTACMGWGQPNLTAAEKQKLDSFVQQLYQEDSGDQVRLIHNTLMPQPLPTATQTFCSLQMSHPSRHLWQTNIPDSLVTSLEQILLSEKEMFVSPLHQITEQLRLASKG